MIQSLQRFNSSACIFVLALDEYSERLVLKLNEPNIRLLTLDKIEDENVLIAKGNRGLVEYYWTLSSVLTAYVFEKYNHEFQTLTYLDSDIFFFSDPQVIFSQISSESSCIITPHNFSERLKDRIVNGKFCVQWVTFVNNREGEKVLFDWRANCLDWCYYKLEDGKMGDQKYLDYWESQYNGVIIDKNLGAGVAPWNYEDMEFSIKDGRILANNNPLIFYHFHQFTQIGIDRFDRLSKFYTDVRAAPDEIYREYELVCEKNYRLVSEINGEAPFEFSNRKLIRQKLLRLAQTYVPHFVKQVIRKFMRY
ncbi:hypothetical protein ACMAY8_07955 [Rhodobacteraceae bacterium nBUS_22]